MKNKTIIALGLLPLCIVACDKKENNTENASVTSNTDNNCLGTVHYTVDGLTYSSVVHSQSEYEELLMWLLSNTSEGRVYLECQGNVRTESSAKETVEFKTTNREEMIEWVAEMTMQGYVVSYEYDESTGFFYGKATK